MTFRATLVLHGKTATGIEVPASIVKELGSGQRPKVTCTINGTTYRTTIAPYSGQFYLPVAAEIRAAAGIQSGDELDVRIELDTAPRIVDVPDDFAGAMAAHDGTRERFDRLAYSHQKEHVRAIDDAKTPETRQRRIEKAIVMINSK